ncbi:MAG: 2-C-methyl-D-erythritol 4-phosphate cytidylyltransferase [Ignavibacteriae bacterium]|nr:2-C-methyl-D-erythritol 4-phosphate cytidylyltransferase [Ignavibacteriota bacterium]
MFKNKKVGVIIPAAGTGSRFGGGVAKQFLELYGKTVLSETLHQFQIHPSIDCIGIAGSTDGIEQIKTLVRVENISKIVWIGIGGTERQDSVWNGLQALQPFSPELVLIHDAVRPFVNGEIIERVLEATVNHGAAIPAVHPKDTVKISDANLLVTKTPLRQQCWQIQTPQGFVFNVLMNAFEQAIRDNFFGTDDASLVERIGAPVKIVEGSYENFKITTREDLVFAELLAKQRMSS